MAYTPNAVVLEGFPFGIFTFTYEIAGVTTDALAATAVGKAVSLDTAAPGRVKLAAAGEEIFGRVYQAEYRNSSGLGAVASVARKFKERLPAAPGHGIVVGERVVGAGAGLVRKAAPGTPAEVTASQGNVVIATGTDYVIVEML